MALIRVPIWCTLLSVAFGCSAEPSSTRGGESQAGTGSSSAGSTGSGGALGTGGGSGGQSGSVGSGGGGTTTTGGSAGTAGSAGASGAGGLDPGGPAPPATWVNATGNLAGMASDCVPVGRVGATPGSARVVVEVALHGMWSSDDGGQSWQALGTGAGSAQITNRASSITFDPDHPDVFWETGTHNGGGLYKTTDAGLSFVELGTMTMSQDAAVDFADPDRKTLLTGTHGAGVYRSTDAGLTFGSVGDTLPLNTLWPFLVDPQTHLIGIFDQDASNPDIGVQRTTDGGASWTKVSNMGPSHDGGFRQASDGSIYYSLVGNSGIARSTDQGESWTKVASAGATFPPGFFGITPIELPGGRLVTLGVDHLQSSLDSGASWQPIGEPLPFPLTNSDFGGVIYSITSKTFFIWHSNCGANAVLDDAIMSAGFDYTL